MKAEKDSRRQAKWSVVGIVVLFLAGVVVAFVLTQTDWRPTATRNYGELVQPIRPVPDVALADAAGKPLGAGVFKGKWTLVYFGSAECLKPCADALYKMRQLASAQGKNEHRVRRVFVVTDPKARDLLRYTLEDYPGTEVVFGKPEAIRVLAAPFAVNGESPLDDKHRLYVVDPLGNFMMHYPPEADLARMNKDLKLLLRASHIG